LSVAKRNDKRLVVVESPAKARTISRILGSEYDVKASVGHVRDLPKSDLGVDVENAFQPKYVVPKEKSKAVKEIRDAARKAGTVYLATDPDREGEAIAWHVLEAAGLDKVPHRRVVFHEITPEAVQEAFQSPRDIDMTLVDAQQARRILDRLVGYRLSPFLWKKVRGGLSAGRVQSVAVRLVVEREREIQSFVPREFWNIEVALRKPDVEPRFKAKLAGLVAKRQKLEIANETEARRVTDGLKSSSVRVLEVQQKTQRRRPSAPFITSTLQQEASRRLGFSAKRTMVVAQQLYEGLSLGADGEVGLITYMRTDSTSVAQSARDEARGYIANRYGKQFLPRSPREHKRKVKGAQEAHEAIRPTSVLRDPERARSYLKNDQYRLYNLIWQRMLASQMADAVFDVTSVGIEAEPQSGGESYLLRASNTQVAFPGFRQVYVEGRDDEEEESLGGNPLPDLAKGDPLDLLDVVPEQRFTEPPPRYTEATLVKALEEKGIGRPSTYAPTMSTVQDRGYVEREGRRLKPSALGFVVNDLLVEHFPDFVDVGFTADMEGDLDAVANGERPWQPVVEELYNPLKDALERAADVPKVVQQTTEKCPTCDEPMVIRWGRRGRFLACSAFPKCRTTRSLDEEEQQPEATDEKCDECGAPMVIRTGRYGRFLACTGYPECKGRRPLAAKTGVACPRCGGDLVERRTKKGRTFYGCST
jgi:DNA topoisomerase-1